MIKYIIKSNIRRDTVRASIVIATIISSTIFSYSIVASTASSSSSLPSLLSLLGFFHGKSSIYAFAQTQNGRGENTNAALSLSNLIKQGSPYQGSTSAPVTVIDFSDLQCPLCQRFTKSTEPQINSTYIQTGKVALVFKHLPNRGFDSTPAALAAQCTKDQGKFWQFQNLLYEKKGQLILAGQAKTI